MSNDDDDGPVMVGSSIGLRDRKKAQQRADLLDVAVRLFRDQGYDRVRMEDIASAANVATKTVYNYFPAKNDFLIAFLRGDRTRFTPDYEGVLTAGKADAVEAVVDLMMCDVGDVNSPSDRALWLEVSAAAIKSRRDSRFVENRLSFTAVLERLLRQYQASGQLRPMLDTRLASDMLHTIYSDRFLRYCADESFSAEQLRTGLLAVVELTFASWIERSEGGEGGHP